MIVPLAAWLYIISAVLTLGSLFAGPFRTGGMSGFATFAMAALFGAVGYGLLNRESWGRWLALGHSLIGWTLGSLAVICILGAVVLGGRTGMLLALISSSGFGAILGVLALITFAIVLASLVINFKLFFYLCSEAGCEEFGVPHGSTQTVLASVGAWIAIFIGQGVMASGGASSLLMNSMMRTATGEESDGAMNDAARIASERRQRADEDAHQRAIRESQQQQEAAAREADNAPPPVPETVASDREPPPSRDQPPRDLPPEQPAEESAAPALYTNNGEHADDGKVSGTKILKCRDASGSVTFTQGYCPAGTKRVEMNPGQ